MVRPGEEKVLKAMKEAKTAQEMVDSWSTQRPGYKRASPKSPLDFWLNHKPEMIFTYAHNQLTQILEHGILDPKTRYLVILGCHLMHNHWEALLPQCCNAKAAGATEEEIMEVAFIACYAVSKAKVVDTSMNFAKIFENPTFKNMGRLGEK